MIYDEPVVQLFLQSDLSEIVLAGEAVGSQMPPPGSILFGVPPPPLRLAGPEKGGYGLYETGVVIFFPRHERDDANNETRGHMCRI
mgnify:CR=1 FL=1